MAAINLRDRDGLHSRLFDVRCPVLWLHGTKDVVYSVENAKDEIKLFVNSPDAQLIVVEGGTHFLSASKPNEVDDALLSFVTKYSKPWIGYRIWRSWQLYITTVSYILVYMELQFR